MIKLLKSIGSCGYTQCQMLKENSQRFWGFSYLSVVEFNALFIRTVVLYFRAKPSNVSPRSIVWINLDVVGSNSIIVY